MVKATKAMKAMLAKTPGKQPVPLQQAVELLKQFGGRKFDQTVEIHMNLGSIQRKQIRSFVGRSFCLMVSERSNASSSSRKAIWRRQPKRLAPMQLGRKNCPSESKMDGSISMSVSQRRT